MRQISKIDEHVAGHPGATGAVSNEVFDMFPYGILVVDRSGEVLKANAAAAELLGEPGLGHARLTCCELLGCGVEAPMEASCITQLAVTGGEPLPELRMDRETSPHGAVWVTAAPLNAEGSRVVFHLRPGDAGDRRRRTNPHWTAGPRLRIYTLGRTAVDSVEGSIGGNWLQHRPGQLLKYLLCERQRMVHADEIAESFWPGSDPGVLNNVRHFVHALRDKLEPERPRRAPSSFVLAGRGGYSFNRDLVWIDADEFEVKGLRGIEAYEQGDDAAAGVLLEEAFALYRGEFLADEPYAEWAFVERERLRDLAGRLLSTLIEISLAQNQGDDALDYSRRLGDMYPFDTAVQRQSISLLLRQGRRSDAVRRFNELRMRMMREFGAGPEFQLSDLGGDAPS